MTRSSVGRAATLPARHAVLDIDDPDAKALYAKSLVLGDAPTGTSPGVAGG